MSKLQHVDVTYMRAKLLIRPDCTCNWIQSISSCRWGVIVSVAAASVALAVVHTAFESFGKSDGGRPEKPQALPQPGTGEKKADGKWKAALWQSAEEVARRAKRAPK